MPQNLRITVPRLGSSRQGVFFVRAPSFIDENGRRRVVQQSLGTKNPAIAKLLALEFCLNSAKGVILSHDHRHSISPWTMNTSTSEFSANGDDDTRNFILALQKLFELGMLSPREVENGRARGFLPSSPIEPIQTIDYGDPLQMLVPLHLQKERSVVESLQTVHEKKVLLDEFMDVFGSGTGIKFITAQEISTCWIPAELNRPNKKHKGKTLSRARLEKRRGYLSKFFTWAKASGFYVGENPMSVKMATKKEIQAQTQSYAEFTTDGPLRQSRLPDLADPHRC